MATMYSCNVGCVSTARPLKTILMEKGLIAPKTLHSKKRKVHFDCVLDYKKCSPDEWAKQLAEILERGVIDFSKRNELGDFGVRRDYTSKEQEELGFYPVYFTDDGSRMSWEARWNYNLDPLFYVSKALPNEVFTYDMMCEGDCDASAYYQDGTYLGEELRL